MLFKDFRNINFKTLKFKREEEITFNCPGCGIERIKYSIKDNNIHYKLNIPSDEYLFYDGDSLPLDKSYFKRVELSGFYGYCRHCDIPVSQIDIDLTDIDIYTGNQQYPYFQVTDPSNLVVNHEGIELYSIMSKDLKIGLLVFYKNATLEKNAIYFAEMDNTVDLCRINIGCFEGGLEDDEELYETFIAAVDELFLSEH